MERERGGRRQAPWSKTIGRCPRAKESRGPKQPVMYSPGLNRMDDCRLRLGRKASFRKLKIPVDIERSSAAAGGGSSRARCVYIHPSVSSELWRLCLLAIPHHNAIKIQLRQSPICTIEEQRTTGFYTAQLKSPIYTKLAVAEPERRVPTFLINFLIDLIDQREIALLVLSRHYIQLLNDER